MFWTIHQTDMSIFDVIKNAWLPTQALHTDVFASSPAAFQVISCINHPLCRARPIHATMRKAVIVKHRSAVVFAGLVEIIVDRQGLKPT